ncbi:MAG: AurF N-oxygenase family protein [Acidimicrobiia bacterium]
MTATFDETVARLSRLSSGRGFDAYADVDWDDPEMVVDPADPRWELGATDPLAATDWYRSQPSETRSAIGLYRYAACMKTGWHFENLLQRGLLAYVVGLPDGAPEFRYAHHELIEESQHTLMFGEFISRSGFAVRGMPRGLLRLVEMSGTRLARRYPMLFFVGVLGGEEPIDHIQRRQLSGGESLHPLAERIMRIHVTEEARHLSFARHSLQRGIPELSRRRRRVLSLVAPVVLGVLARTMLGPPPDLVRHFGIPKDVVRDATRSPEGRQIARDAVSRTRRLLTELGLVRGPARLVWRIMGIGGK